MTEERSIPKYLNYWCSLPHDILKLIAEKVSFVDCLSMSKVCMSWNGILGEEHPSTQRHGLPCLLVSGLGNNETKICVSILENRIWELKLPESCGKYCWGSFCDWLIMVNNVYNITVEVKLVNPFSGSQINLPPLQNEYHKMVLSGVPYENNFTCMAVQSRRFGLAFWSTGANSWTEIERITDKPFQDAVFYNGSFYLLDDGLNVWKIDVRDIYSDIDGALPHTKSKIFKASGRGIMQELRNEVTKKTFTYLVEFVGKLLLVLRYFNFKRNKWIETKKIEVYVCDFGKSQWKKVDDLGDEMIFLGKCCSTSFSAKELGVGIRNSIYLCNDPMDPWNEWDNAWDLRFVIPKKTPRTHVNNWSIFTFGNEKNNDKSFFFRGYKHMWIDTWFTAPSWWCCRNIPPIQSK